MQYRGAGGTCPETKKAGTVESFPGGLYYTSLITLESLSTEPA